MSTQPEWLQRFIESARKAGATKAKPVEQDRSANEDFREKLKTGQAEREKLGGDYVRDGDDGLC